MASGEGTLNLARTSLRPSVSRSAPPPPPIASAAYVGLTVVTCQ